MSPFKLIDWLIDKLFKKQNRFAFPLHSRQPCKNLKQTIRLIFNWLIDWLLNWFSKLPYPPPYWTVHILVHTIVHCPAVFGRYFCVWPRAYWIDPLIDAFVHILVHTFVHCPAVFGRSFCVWPRASALGLERSFPRLLGQSGVQAWTLYCTVCLLS